MSYEYDEYGNPHNGFDIDDVNLTAEEEVPIKERVEVPEGTWNMQVIEALPKAYYDKTDINNEQIKRLIPLEVIDEGPYQGAWAFMSVYMAPDNPENQKQMTKYNSILDPLKEIISLSKNAKLKSLVLRQINVK